MSFAVRMGRAGGKTSRVTLLVSMFAAACGSSTKAPPPRDPGDVDVKSKTISTARKDDEGEIVGKVERLPADPKRRKMVIWGKVTQIIEKKHDQLPEVKVVSQGGVGDPVTEIKNETPFNLTLWFAGQCAHHTEVKAGTTATVVFCPGQYNIAAVVDNKNFLPLVRENQEFKGGTAYVLQVVVKQRPKD
jgi:hypothetical protein